MVISAALYGDCHRTSSFAMTYKSQATSFHFSLIAAPQWRNLDVYRVAFKLADGFFHIAAVKNRFATYHNVNAKTS